jgi:hypothetical protein
VYPGDWYREPDESHDSGGNFRVEANGTAERPIVVTAADRDELPWIHSCDPADPSHCPMPALAVYGSHVIVDHLAIRGRVQLWGGTGSVMQHLECTHGWGACGDGNWSCLRIEWCTDCRARFNLVHSVSGAGAGEACLDGEQTDFEDRGSGLKEFQSVDTIWEFNTVRWAPRWAYDLHRNSQGSIVRFNRFEFLSTAINAHRTRGFSVVGNLLVGTPDAGSCAQFGGRNEDVRDEPHWVELRNNTCVRAVMGLMALHWDGDEPIPTTIRDNVIADLHGGEAEDPRNLVMPFAAEHESDRNAFDAAGDYRAEEYGERDTRWDDLDGWRGASGLDAASAEEDGGACVFASAPDEDRDDDYDLHVTGGACATLAEDRGEVGAYAITSCVGHDCG